MFNPKVMSSAGYSKFSKIKERVFALVLRSCMVSEFDDFFNGYSLLLDVFNQSCNKLIYCMLIMVLVHCYMNQVFFDNFVAIQA